MRILIVDDDQPLAYMLAEQLRRLEPAFTVDAVATADEARAAVLRASAAYDVFLLDQRLDGSDVNGITLMQELRRSSLGADFVILTGYDDAESGLRAFEAGAHRYLTKPFDTRELLHILKALERSRSIQLERNGLEKLAAAAAQLQGAVTERAVAEAIVGGGLLFGFQRARLRLLVEPRSENAEDSELVGVSEVGNVGLQGFETLKVPLARLLYSKRAIEAGEPICYVGRELGPGGSDAAFAVQGFEPPSGPWFKIPLLSAGRPIGSLSLDNGGDAVPLEVRQRELLRLILGLFGQQAAAALERARLLQHTERQAQEALVMSNVSRAVTTRAASGNLDELLDEVRVQIRDQLKVSVNSFFVVLVDRDTGELDFRRQYERDKLEPRHWRAGGSGLAGYIIAKNESVLTNDTDEFRREHGITQYGEKAACWLGAPLCVQGTPIGALALQDYTDPQAYNSHHRELLEGITDQVAGAIALAYKAERDAELRRRTSSVDLLNQRLPSLIRESEDSFWHAALTIVTHRDGHSFNRAVLFWFDEEGRQMQGRMGIGYLRRADAIQAWELDAEEQKSLNGYFASPHLARQTPTPLQTEVLNWSLVTGDEGCLCRQVWVDGRRRVVSSLDLAGCLPADYLRPELPDREDFDCALLPAKVDSGVRGLLLVDNAFDGEPLRPSDLDELEQLLTQTMQVWNDALETSRIQRIGAAYDEILQLNRKLTEQASTRPIKELLYELCSHARDIMRADCTVLYPYWLGSYEMNLVTCVGLNHEDEFDASVKDKLRQQGVTFFVIQSGTLVVPDVSKSELTFGGQPLAEHKFLKREQITALIGVPIRNARTGDPLGVVYFDYRSHQRFLPQDIAKAEHLASIAAAMIANAREARRQEEGLRRAEYSEQRHRKELRSVRHIQAQALSPDSTHENVIRSILQNVDEAFGSSAKITLAMLDWETVDEEIHPIRWDYTLNRVKRLHKVRRAVNQGPIGAALRDREMHMAGNKMARAIYLGVREIGGLMIQKHSAKDAFSPDEQDALQRLATVSALAIDNVRTRDFLRTVSETTGAVSDQALEDTLATVVNAARKVGPDIECITLWYKDPEQNNELISGAAWGIRNRKHDRTNARTDRLVREVMRRQKPLFAAVVEREECLHGDFIRDEGIASTAAFPLRSGNDHQAIGALFLSYRHNHEFSALEYMLFPIFANAAATVIHDAQSFDALTRAQKRLEAAMEVSSAVGTSLGLDEVLQRVLQTLQSRFARDQEQFSPYLMLYNEDEEVLELPAAAARSYSSDEREYSWRRRLPLEGVGLTCRVVRETRDAGKIVVRNFGDVQSESDYVEFQTATRSELVAGLISGGRLLGALVIKSPRPHAFTVDDERLMEAVAQQVALAIDRAQKAAELDFHKAISPVTTWAAELAHDLNRDIYSIRSRAEWLLRPDTGLTEKARQWAKEIDQKAANLADTTRSVNGDHGAELETFDVNELLHRQVTDLLARRWPKVALDWQCDQPCLLVRGYKERFWRAIRHLIRNAAEAMDSAGKITLRTTIWGRNAEIEIEDEGPGVPDELRRILLKEPFTSKGNTEERGYGLLIAKAIIQSMDGSISLRSSETGRGAVFVIKLPIEFTIQ